MVNRVLIDQSGLKISKPGIDVTTAGWNELLFRGDGHQLEVVMSGSHRIQGDRNGIYGVDLGLTYAYPTFMVFALIPGNDGVDGEVVQTGLGMIYIYGTALNQTQWCHVVARNNGFTVNRYLHSGSFSNGYWLKYWVIDYEMEIE